MPHARSNILPTCASMRFLSACWFAMTLKLEDLTSKSRITCSLGVLERFSEDEEKAAGLPSVALGNSRCFAVLGLPPGQPVTPQPVDSGPPGGGTWGGLDPCNARDPLISLLPRVLRTIRADSSGPLAPPRIASRHCGYLDSFARNRCVLVVSDAWLGLGLSTISPQDVVHLGLRLDCLGACSPLCRYLRSVGG